MLKRGKKDDETLKEHWNEVECADMKICINGSDEHWSNVSKLFCPKNFRMLVSVNQKNEYWYNLGQLHSHTFAL